MQINLHMTCEVIVNNLTVTLLVLSVPEIPKTHYTLYKQLSISSHMFVRRETRREPRANCILLCF